MYRPDPLPAGSSSDRGAAPDFIMGSTARQPEGRSHRETRQSRPSGRRSGRTSRGTRLSRRQLPRDPAARTRRFARPVGADTALSGPERALEPGVVVPVGGAYVDVVAVRRGTRRGEQARPANEAARTPVHGLVPSRCDAPYPVTPSSPVTRCWTMACDIDDREGESPSPLEPRLGGVPLRVMAPSPAGSTRGRRVRRRAP